jgi:hypothetical protein
LDLEFSKKEAIELFMIPEVDLIKKITEIRPEIERYKSEFNKIMDDADSVEEGKAKWKILFESEYCKKFDHAVLMYLVCWARTKAYESCKVGIGPYHLYDTRDEELKKEYSEELHKIVTEANSERYKRMHDSL